MNTRLGIALIGLALGFSLERIGFSSWDEVHGMFTFASLRLFLTFLTAVLLLTVAWFVVNRVAAPQFAPRPIHRGTLAGGAIFGVGWALSGACPAIAWVQIGEGQLGAVLTVLGMLLGNWAYSLVHERLFAWSPSTCSEQADVSSRAPRAV